MKTKPQREIEINALNGKMSPQNIEAEECVLAALLFSSNERLNVFNILSASEAFYREDHQHLFKAIKTLFDGGEKIDMVTVAAELKKMECYQSVGGARFISGIANKVSSTDHLAAHTRLVMESWMKRSILTSATILTQGCYDEGKDVFELLDEAEKVIADSTGQLLKSGDPTFEEIIAEEMTNVANSTEGQIVGATTGIAELDARLSGLCPPDFTIVAARPGAGKSSLVFSIMTHMGFEGVPCGLVTLEMSRGQVFNRMISILGQIPAETIRNRTMDKEQKERYFHFGNKMLKWPIYINETANTLSKLRVKATMWKNKYGIKALFVDYLQLMGSESGRKGQSRENEISDISRGLKQLAKQLEIPIIALSQLSREVEKRPSKMPQLSDLRESGSLEQDADFVIFLMRPEYYKMTGTITMGANEYEVDGLCIADLGKSRHGKTGEFVMKFDGPIMKFQNYF